MMITHDEATRLEYIIRDVFNCDRFDVMGIANADHLERWPMDAAIVVFAPLYKEQRRIPEIDTFVDEFSCIFNFPEDYTYDKDTVDRYIETLKKLTKKYCQ